jgi:Ca-activated chloride channel family protein
VQYDLGTAAYKAGELEKALQAFSQAIRSRDSSLRAKAEYNLGNTLFQRGSAQKERPPKVQDWKNSLQHYEEALRIDPKNEDAQFNRSVVLKLLEEQEQEKKKEDQKKEDEKKEQEKKDGQKGDQKDKKQENGEEKNQDKKEGGEEKKEGEGKDQPSQQGQSKKDRGEEGRKGDQQEREKREGKDQEATEQEAAAQKEKPKGEIGSTEKGREEEQQRESERAQAAAEQEAAEAGQMTPAQARSLLDSLKSEDDRIRLLNPKTRMPRDGTIRDW